MLHQSENNQKSIAKECQKLKVIVMFVHFLFITQDPLDEKKSPFGSNGSTMIENGGKNGKASFFIHDDHSEKKQGHINTGFDTKL